MIKRYLTSAALIAAGMLVVSSARATVVDLSTADSGSVTNQYGTAVFYENGQQPTGTGYIDPFLRLQANGTEQGYNTSGRIGAQAPLDDLSDPNFTTNVTFADLQSTALYINGTTYYGFLLDVNEPNGAKSIITLDQLQVYTSTTGSQTTTSFLPNGNLALSNSTLRYSLDTANQNNQIIIDASRNHGSGSGDVYIYIPASDFTGTSATDYVYLYALFAQADTMQNPDGSQGGFEEFALARRVTPVPEMSALFPIVGLIVAVGSTHILRRRRMARALV